MRSFPHDNNLIQNHFYEPELNKNQASLSPQINLFVTL